MQSFKSPQEKTFCDLSCGCSGFLYTLALELHRETGKPLSVIYRDNLFGLDIQAYSIQRSKILLSLLAIKTGEDKKEFSFNLEVGNALSFQWCEKNEVIRKHGGFHAIVGNPPYVCSKNIDDESRQLLANWNVNQSGNPDLYISFFQLGVENLARGGILGYITMNSFFKSLNARQLRTYFAEKKNLIRILDFGNEQIFKGRRTYTCICFIHNQKSDYIKFIKTDSISIQRANVHDFHSINYNLLDNFNGWQLSDKATLDKVRKIQKTGVPLVNLFEIRNGFATLNNKLYLFKPTHEDEKYYWFVKYGKTFQVEKAICRDAIKANILRTESDINKYKEKIIFPYHLRNQNQLVEDWSSLSTLQIKLISEKKIREEFPYAYKYLLEYKSLLAERDKGKKEYEEWYAYGRSQALNLPGYKLFFPYISDRPCFTLCEDKNLMFYNGYALISDNKDELLVLKKILESDVFWFYIQKTSKPYKNDFYTLAKNYIKHFGIYPFTATEKSFLLHCDSKNDINEFVASKYNITNVIPAVALLDASLIAS